MAAGLESSRSRPQRNRKPSKPQGNLPQRFLDTCWLLLLPAAERTSLTLTVPIRHHRRLGAGGRVSSKTGSQGDQIGYLDGDDLYLIPDASYQVAQRGASGEGVGVNSKTLAKRMDEKGLLRSKEPGRNTAKKVLAGARRYVLHLHKNSLVVSTEPKPRLPIEQQIAVLDVLIDLADGRGEEFGLPTHESEPATLHCKTLLSIRWMPGVSKRPKSES